MIGDGELQYPQAAYDAFSGAIEAAALEAAAKTFSFSRIPSIGGALKWQNDAGVPVIADVGQALVETYLPSSIE